MTDGRRRKLEAHALLEAHRESVIRDGRRALLMAALQHGTATADDVRSAVELPPDISAKLFGVVPGPLARAGIIRADGFVNTGRAAAHARPVRVWRLADRAGALAWLAAHPEQPAAVHPTEVTLFDMSTNATADAGTPVGQY